MLNPQEHEGSQGPQRDDNGLEAIASQVVDAGLSVHRALGPGLLESVYEHCLARELAFRGVATRSQVGMPIRYRGEARNAAYRLDLVVADRIIVEVKAVEALSCLHEAQILTYLKLSRLRLGFLMNFNVPLFKDGIRRFRV